MEPNLGEVVAHILAELAEPFTHRWFQRRIDAVQQPVRVVEVLGLAVLEEDRLGLEQLALQP
eukprot:10144703-Alexandrium_andersonii.AAC.1